MKVTFFTVVALLFAAFLVGEVLYELLTGKLLVRGWKVFKSRDENPMLYWSGISLKILVVLFMVSILIFAAVKVKD